jgi:hypothetical protein
VTELPEGTVRSIKRPRGKTSFASEYHTAGDLKITVTDPLGVVK